MTSDIGQRIEDAGSRAEELRQQGFHCSEAVLRAAAAAVGAAVDASVLRLSTGLAGGGGGYGDRCGALEAGALLVGLVYGRTDVEADSTCAGQLVKWLHGRFAAEFGSTACNVIRPISVTRLSDDFSCGPIYRRGAELAAEAVLTGSTLCLICPPYDPELGEAARVPLDAGALREATGQIIALAGDGHVIIAAGAREAQEQKGITDADVAFSLANLRRAHPAWGGTYTVEGSRPDRYGLTSVVRLRSDPEGGDVVEVLALF